jgi:hypothetical protein
MSASDPLRPRPNSALSMMISGKTDVNAWAASVIERSKICIRASPATVRVESRNTHRRASQATGGRSRRGTTTRVRAIRLCHSSGG